MPVIIKFDLFLGFQAVAPALCPMPPTTTAPGERKEGIPGGSHPTGQKVGTGIGLVAVSDNGMALRLPLLILTGSHGLRQLPIPSGTVSGVASSLGL